MHCLYHLAAHYCHKTDAWSVSINGTWDYSQHCSHLGLIVESTEIWESELLKEGSRDDFAVFGFLRGGRVSTLGLGRTLTLRYSLVNHNCKGCFFGGQIDPSILVGVLSVFPHQNPNIVTMYNRIQLKKATFWSRKIQNLLKK